MTEKTPVFIVGSPRSGTTLLQRLLDAHPAMAVAPETHFMRRFWLNRQQFGNLEVDANFARVLAAVTAAPEFSDLHLDAEVWTQAAWKGERSYAALFWLLLDSFAQVYGAEVAGEKTPNHVFFLTELRSFFPAARFVHIVRDPRAVVDSWRRSPLTSGFAWRDAARWRRHVRAALTCQDPNLFTLSYEDLVRDPEKCLLALCRFLNLAFEPDMLLYYLRASTAFDPQREPWKARALQPISSDLATHWQNELSPAEIAAIEAVTWKEMLRFGYEPLTPPVRLVPLFLVYQVRLAADRIRRAMQTRWQRNAASSFDESVGQSFPPA